MTPSDPDRLPEELLPVAVLLRERRPQATSLELDAVKRRLRADRPRIQKGTSMKSRLAMMAMLVFGLLMSGTGAGLAVSGLSATDDASISQYTPVTPPPPAVAPTTPGAPTPTAPVAPSGGTLPTTTSGGPESDTGVKGEQAEKTPTEQTPAAQAPATLSPAPQVQPARQLAAKASDELPFTGFAAIPVLIAGIALLAGGLVLRRRTTA